MRSLKLHTGWLQSLEIANYAANISDDDVLDFVSRNNRLREIMLLNINLTDKSIIHILGHCPDIVSISTGGDSSGGDGRIKGHFASYMNKQENMHKWEKLTKITFWDQPIDRAQIRGLLKKRPNLHIDQLQTPSPEVVKSLTDAGISPSNVELSDLHAEDFAKASQIVPVVSFWRNGKVTGPDMADLVRLEQTRLDAIRRCKAGLQAWAEYEAEAEEFPEESDGRGKRTLDPASPSSPQPARKVARREVSDLRHAEDAKQADMTSSTNVNEASSSMENTSGNVNAGSSSDGSALTKSVIKEETLDEDNFGVNYEAAETHGGDALDEEEDAMTRTVIKRDDSV
ncbi:hypothetical protein J4E93_005007 [Alternaria ventricosa]|uniref:uncharacterized protein n=1 Tax=Alternaria ventricosa TaxID=1187951 RepID=UPI0020C5799C|nr:uncharacterized protein J4E93_005007 [Alternaria ventricosa]KAI4646783.1 hypothetical protein J4E93_005007 [Alternaria ventricosa]